MEDDEVFSTAGEPSTFEYGRWTPMRISGIVLFVFAIAAHSSLLKLAAKQRRRLDKEDDAEEDASASEKVPSSSRSTSPATPNRPSPNRPSPNRSSLESEARECEDLPVVPIDVSFSNFAKTALNKSTESEGREPAFELVARSWHTQNNAKATNSQSTDSEGLDTFMDVDPPLDSVDIRSSSSHSSYSIQHQQLPHGFAQRRQMAEKLGETQSTGDTIPQSRTCSKSLWAGQRSPSPSHSSPPSRRTKSTTTKEPASFSFFNLPKLRRVETSNFAKAMGVAQRPAPRSIPLGHELFAHRRTTEISEVQYHTDELAVDSMREARDISFGEMMDEEIYGAVLK